MFPDIFKNYYLLLKFNSLTIIFNVKNYQNQMASPGLTILTKRRFYIFLELPAFLKNSVFHFFTLKISETPLGPQNEDIPRIFAEFKKVFNKSRCLQTQRPSTSGRATTCRGRTRKGKKWWFSTLAIFSKFKNNFKYRRHLLILFVKYAESQLDDEYKLNIYIIKPRFV